MTRLFTILILFIIFSITASAQIFKEPEDEKAFFKAREEGTIEAYQKFLKEYPNGFYAPIVEKQIGVTKSREGALREIKNKAILKHVLLGSYNGALALESNDGGNSAQIGLTGM